MWSRFVRPVAEFLKSEDGPTSTEHAIVLALIITFCVSSIHSIGNKATQSFTQVSNALVAGS
jgi:Flp pilus assembly pilin Flp